MNLTNFGEQFAGSVLKNVYAKSVTPAIVNKDYEGEIKKPGDRVNILSFLNNILLSDYVVGTDMSSETIVDHEDQLVVEKRKYYNFSLDRLEDLFTYAGDIPASLLDNQSAVLETAIDTYVLDKFAQNVHAGSWVGIDLVVVGSTNKTEASIVTTATGGTVTLSFENVCTTDVTNGSSVENPVDGNIYFGGFQAVDVGKGFRLRSTDSRYVTPWYRISSVTSSVVATLTEWDEAVSGSDFAERYTLRGAFGGDGRNFARYDSLTADEPFIANASNGWGWEIKAAIATSVTAATIYDQVTLLAEALDENAIPAEGRLLVLPPAGVTMLRQCAETQPTGIAEIYTGTVINGRVARFGAFDVHVATGAKLSSRAGHSTADGLAGASATLSVGARGYFIPATNKSAMTYADKWSESRVVDAENQFAKKYQGLFLYGATVPCQRRKAVACLFGSF